MPTILNLNRKHTSERYFDEVHFKHLLTQVFLFAPVMLSNEAQCSSPHPSTKVPVKNFKYYSLISTHYGAFLIYRDKPMRPVSKKIAKALNTCAEKIYKCPVKELKCKTKAVLSFQLLSHIIFNCAPLN